MTDVSAHGNYVRPDNLVARISIHQYAVNPNWMRWLFERELPSGTERARILDVGCGTGALWAANQTHIEPTWSITLVDSSPAMLAATLERVGAIGEYVLADIERLPFDDGSFDIVLANHMLYHVADRPRAFAEVRRVLSPGGACHCSTNGRGHLAQLMELLPESMGISHHAEEFGLETGPPQLDPFFAGVGVQRFDNALEVPDVEPMLAYIRSSERFHEGADLGAVRDAVAAAIRRDGCFHITTRPGLISATRR